MQLYLISSFFSDLLMAGIVFLVGSVYWLDRMPGALGLAELLGIVAICGAVGRTSAKFLPLSQGKSAAPLVLGCALSIGAYAAVRSQLPHLLMSRTTFTGFIAAFGILQICCDRLCARIQAESGPVERLRWMLLAAIALLIHRPLLTTASIGSGDSYWYTIMVSDFIAQWRSGVFPVLAGQSEFAFNGAISPLRLAAGLQHFAGMVDIVTLHSLPYRGILNLTLLLSLVGGAFTCYGCLRAIEPRAAWLAWVLSLLYTCCPGVLGLVYIGDLFMSVTTVFFLPVVFYGVWRTLTRGDLQGVLIMVAGTAALWYCHPPIAVWTTMAVALTQVLRVPQDGSKWGTWRDWLIGAACFGVLTSYCFVSVATLDLPIMHSARAVGLENMVQAFPASLRPVSQSVSAISDYQLGWALTGVLLAGFVGLSFSRSRRPGAVLCATMLVLLAYVVPTPWLQRRLWLSLPQTVSDMTYSWPMQRFYVLLACLTVFSAFATLGPIAAKHRRWGGALLFVFLGGLYWSGREVGKFHAHAALSRTSTEDARNQLRLQNIVLTRYGFSSFPKFPPYFSHGFIDPLMQNRLLAPGTFLEIGSNRAGLEADLSAGRLVQEGVLTATQPDPALPTLKIEPALRLEPHRHYALTVDFAHPEFVGGLKLFGPQSFRFYWLPDSGYGVALTGPSRAFGALPGQSRTITLWTDGETPEDLSLWFYFTGDAPKTPVSVFARYRFKEYDPADLPIAVTQWAPYRARLKASMPAFLETPRIFIRGYQARVNGREVEVLRSPDALVMIPVPAGEDVVELSYRGPYVLRFAYFLSLGGWLIILTWLALQRARPSVAAA